MNALKKRRRPLKKKKLRPLFSVHQIQTMKKEFLKCRYVSEARRAELPSDLYLTEMKWKPGFKIDEQSGKKKSKKNWKSRHPKFHSFMKEVASKVSLGQIQWAFTMQTASKALLCCEHQPFSKVRQDTVFLNMYINLINEEYLMKLEHNMEYRKK